MDINSPADLLMVSIVSTLELSTAAVNRSNIVAF